MSRTKLTACCAAILGFAAPALPAQAGASGEKVDLAVVQRIRAEERQRSKVMDTLFYLTDVNGPRLANSPSYFASAQWVTQRLSEDGISARTEPWPGFGRGWKYTKYYAAMTEPQYMPLIGFPLAWSSSTPGAVTADAAIASVYSEADMETYRGKLKGKIVLNLPPRTLELNLAPLASRYSDAELRELDRFPESSPTRSPTARRNLPIAWQRLSPAELTALRAKINAFFASEQVAAIIVSSYGGADGTVFGAQAGSRSAEESVPPATIAVTAEHYNRIYRLVSHGIPVKIVLDVQAEILPPQDAANVIAEIPGASKKDEVVMLGAHLDSWQGGTGATDNGAGSAVMIEAMRLLKTLNLKMARTVRLALWDGEEQGLLGSKAYVKAHFGDPETMHLLPEHSKLAAYFNLDNGSGKIRGVYLQGNDMCRPIFEQWLTPFKDMDAANLTIQDTGSTDHVSFDAVGLPGFQFIQDELEYSSLTHHSNMDVYDHLSEPDLKQAATIVAAFAYLAATRPEMLPRKPLPAPKPTIPPSTTEPNKAKPTAPA